MEPVGSLAQGGAVCRVRCCLGPSPGLDPAALPGLGLRAVGRFLVVICVLFHNPRRAQRHPIQGDGTGPHPGVSVTQPRVWEGHCFLEMHLPLSPFASSSGRPDPTVSGHVPRGFLGAGPAGTRLSNRAGRHRQGELPAQHVTRVGHLIPRQLSGHFAVEDTVASRAGGCTGPASKSSAVAGTQVSGPEAA